MVSNLLVFRKGNWRLMIWCIAILALITAHFFRPYWSKALIYPVYRRVFANVALAPKEETIQWRENITVHYDSVDEDSVVFILDMLADSIDILGKEFNYQTTSSKLHILVHHSREQMANAIPFGNANHTNSLGIYHAGTMHVLSPTTWLKDLSPTQVETTYRAKGPILHELTHWYVDQLAKGNCPLWLNEGIAQYIERKHLNYLLPSAQPLDLTQRNYSFSALQHSFGRLSEQVLAYRQALSLTDYLVDKYGFAYLPKVLRSLSRGNTFERATELEGEELTKLWLLWLKGD